MTNQRCCLEGCEKHADDGDRICKEHKERLRDNKEFTKEELYFMWKEAQHMVDNAVKQIVRFTGGTISKDDIREGLRK
jgi:hypothetical protein